MTGVIWVSEEEKAREWAIAKGKLTLNGALLPDGSKVSRKDPTTKLTHSFMVMDGRIIALSGKGIHLGKGEFGHTKLAEDERGNLIALKIITNIPERCDAEVAEAEAQIAHDLGIAGECVTRFRSGSSSKLYIAYKYLGKPLEDYLRENDDTLTLDQRYELCIKIALALDEIHTGKRTKSKKSYIHNDVHLNNIVIDDQGNPHFIDFEKTLEKSLDEDGWTRVSDIIRMLNAFRCPDKDSIFTNPTQVYLPVYSMVLCFTPPSSSTRTHYESNSQIKPLYIYLNPNDIEADGSYSIIRYALQDPYGVFQEGSLTLSELGHKNVKPNPRRLTGLHLNETETLFIREAILAKTNALGFTLLHSILADPGMYKQGYPQSVPSAFDIAEILTLYRLQLGAFHGELASLPQEFRLRIVNILNLLSPRFSALNEKLNGWFPTDASFGQSIRKYIFSHLEEKPEAFPDSEFERLQGERASELRQIIYQIIGEINCPRESLLQGEFKPEPKPETESKTETESKPSEEPLDAVDKEPVECPTATTFLIEPTTKPKPNRPSNSSSFQILCGTSTVLGALALIIAFAALNVATAGTATGIALAAIGGLLFFGGGIGLVATNRCKKNSEKLEPVIH